MARKQFLNASWFAVAITILVGALAAPRSNGAALNAPQVLEASRLQGGLVVQIECREHALPATLASSGGFLVQVLDTDAPGIEQARKFFQAAGMYGLATAEVLEDAGQLPYTENLVNLLMLQAGAKVEAKEALRVICPGGTVIAPASLLTADTLKSAGFADVHALAGDAPWVIARKPWPAEMDTWPQPRHGADGNVVSRDRLVAPPRRVRWIAGPTQEISNMVSSGGRNFYGGVLARDSFNGLRLWQQQLSPTPARGGFGFGGKTMAAPEPIAVGTMLLVYDQGRVIGADGATGRIIREYPEAGTPVQMLADGGLLLAVSKTAVRAVDIASGQLRWKHDCVEPQYVVAGDGGVYLVEGGTSDAVGSAAQPSRREYALVALDLISGQSRWRRQDLPWIPAVRNLVYYKGLLACENSTLNNDRPGNVVEVVSAADGKPVQQREFRPATSHYQQARAIFIDNLMWAQTDKGWSGTDWITGELKHTFRSGTGHCFPPVATVRYLMAGEMHLTDLHTGTMDINPITKGNCSRDGGFMPANGLIYTAPKHCICWPMLRGYTALAPAAFDGPANVGSALRTSAVRGADPTHSAPSSSDWPCYRHDAWRSGSTAVTIPTALKVRWNVKLGSRPAGPIADDWRDDPYVRGLVTAPVVAGGKVYVARPDVHELVALNEATGAEAWRVTVDGRIDTPPTIHAGLCLFGTSSGFVYCLRADDGNLVWRFRAAENDQRIVVYGQVESPWPVPGSVLVTDDVLYFAAGRHSLADGGIRIFALDPGSGKLIWNQRLKSVPQKNFYDSTGLEFDNFDLLHREENSVTMSRWLFDRQTGKVTVRAKSGFAHLVTGGTGVVVPRGFWSYAPRNESEQNRERPFVRPLLTFQDNSVYGLTEDRKTVFRRNFNLAGVEDFDKEWFKGWSTYEAARKGGDLWRTQRLAPAQWAEKALPASDNTHRADAIVLTANAIVVASQQGGLALLSREDGKPVGQAEIPPVVWDGLAVTAGGVFVSTQDGQVMCLK